MPVPIEMTAKDSEEEELMRMANAITSVPFHLQREFTDAELVEFKRCFDQIDVDREWVGCARRWGGEVRAQRTARDHWHPATTQHR